MNKFNESIIKRLSQLERRRSWLVEKTGITKGAIYGGIKDDTNWTIATASKIATALGLTIDEMMKGDWEE